MDYTFIFKISKDSISINKTNRSIDKKGLNNTNIIDTRDLRFSPEYIKENSELVSTFLNVIILKYNITTCIINTDDMICDLVKLTNSWERINKIIFKADITLNFDVFMVLLDNKYLTSIECYNMPPYLMERLDMNKHINITIREKKHFASRFMIENMLNTYSDIYYKKSIIITDNYNEKELEVIKNFLAINNKLKIIRFIKYSNESLSVILNELKNHNEKNITIIIDEKGNDLNQIYKTVPYLKKMYKKYLADNNIKFKVNYSFEYKRKNFFKEFNLKVLSTIILIVIIMVLVILGRNAYIEYKDTGIVEEQMTEINDIINQYTSVVTEPVDPDNPATPSNEKVIPSTYTVDYSRVFEDLLQINSDTVAWIKVNNTRIDYPVVQAKDNSFYLWRDFKKQRNSMGWLYMDYRNDPKELNQNTIIYGHNVKGGLMFGTMGSMFNKYYLSNKKNNIITLNTQNANMKFQIFSMYRIETTTDYLQNEFYSKEEYRNFLNTIQSRSQFTFDVPVGENDKILTLSTCHSNTSRNVIHAKLIEVENNITAVEVQTDDQVVEPSNDGDYEVDPEPTEQ